MINRIIVNNNSCRCWFQYEEYIEQFKEIHKESESLKSIGLSTNDIKKDIQSMEDEKEQLAKRIERVKRKVHIFLSISVLFF